MNKTFEIKVFNLDGSYFDNIEKTIIINDFTYSANINGGQGEAVVLLDLSFGNDYFSKGKIIKVFGYTEDFKEGILLYSGQINKTTRIIKDGIEQIEISSLGLGTIASMIDYNNSGNYVFTKTDTASNIIKNIVDCFSLSYPGFGIYYDNTSIETTTEIISVDFDYEKISESLKKVCDSANFNFFIEADGRVVCGSKLTPILWDDNSFWDDNLFWREFKQETYILTSGYDVQEIQVEENSENIVNRYILERKSGIIPPEENIESQNIYGLRTLKESKTDIVDISTAQKYAQNYIEKNSIPKNIISCVVNNKFSIEKLHPMDIITIVNIDYVLKNLQIQKIKYNFDYVEIEVESFDSFAKEVLFIN